MKIVLPEPPDLLRFAWFPPDYKTRIAELAQLAQPEPWEYEGQATGDLPILQSYLRYTFRRLHETDKIVVEGDCAAFNTNLYTPNLECIFVVLEKNKHPDRQPWIFKGFATESDRRLLGTLTKLPAPARYFERLDDLLYDPDLELIPNVDHLVEDAEERFPPHLRGGAYFRRLLLPGVIQAAEKRVAMNYRTAVPQFYFGPAGRLSGRVQLLLPLCFENPTQTDAALVVEAERNEAGTTKSYRASTIITLEMAYNNARLIARPDADWIAKRGRQETSATEPRPGSSEAAGGGRS